eukprot:SRR837773.6008.p1 GENE.SRR837773.6008~~SRR837773.6008.p1  ORF type:complete len:279 (+),score=74.57 SRR837773.6008:31-837(+)
MEPTFTIRMMNGSSFTVSATGPVDEGSPAPGVGQLRRCVAKTMGCSPCEVVLTAEGSELKSDEVLKRPEPPEIDAVRVPALSTEHAEALKAALEAQGTVFEPGLTEEEFTAFETRFGVTLPPELKSFLAVGMPTGGQWTNFRNVEEFTTLENFHDGVLFDVKENDFWWEGSANAPGWGEQPEDSEEALDLASEKLKEMPKMIPIYSHRAMLSTDRAGLPVLSIHQTDIISYGLDFADYIRAEFNIEPVKPKPEMPDAFSTVIPFWGEL